jgi:protein TonB
MMLERLDLWGALSSAVGVSACGHLAFLLVAFFVFQAAVEPVPMRDLGESVEFQTLSVPLDVFKSAAPIEPEREVAAAPEDDEAVAEEPPPIRRRVPKRRRIARKPDLIAVPVVEGSVASEVSVPALAASVVSVQDPVDDPILPAKVPVVAKVVVDHGTLTRGYVVQISRLLREGKTYPRSARRARVEGKVVVEVVIDSQGRIVATRIHRSSGSRVLDDAAVAHVLALRSLPAPPGELGWKRKTLRVPFTYRLRA